jgi:hypothetical protein
MPVCSADAVRYSTGCWLHIPCMEPMRPITCDPLITMFSDTVLKV